jgi:hypothetical protein
MFKKVTRICKQEVDISIENNRLRIIIKLEFEKELSDT